MECQQQIETKEAPRKWFSAEWFSIMGVLLTAIGLMLHQGHIQSQRADLLNQQLNQTIQFQSERSDKILESFQKSVSRQSARADKLYDMIYEVAKEKK